MAAQSKEPKATDQPEESKTDRFRRLASSRTNDALTAMRKLQVLANQNSYEYTDEQVGAIVKALTDETERVRSVLTGRKVVKRGGFTL